MKKKHLSCIVFVIILICAGVLGIVISVQTSRSENAAPKVLSEMSDKELHRFLKEYHVEIPDTYDVEEAQIMQSVRKLIVAAENNPNISFAYSATAALEFSQEVRDAVNEYYGVDPEELLQIERPEDFAVCLEWWIDPEQKNILNTFEEGYIQKDLVLDGVAKVEYVPDEWILDQIYKAIVDYNLTSIDREMTSKVLATGDTEVAVIPCTEYVLRFHMNGQDYELKGDATVEAYVEEQEDAFRFREAMILLQALTRGTEEYQRMPEANGAYE